MATLAVVGGLAWLVTQRVVALRERDAGTERGAIGGPVPIEVANVARGPIELRRSFSGTLEASARFVVAPKVGGRIERLSADLADTVGRGQIIAELDNDEYEQAVAQAEAELAVATANRAEAQSSLEIAGRELERMRTLHQRGVASDSQFDVVRSEHLARHAQLEVAEAQVVRAEAMVQTARIRLGYTSVAATWAGGDERRIVAERHVDEGDTVAPNTPLLTIVELDPLTGVIFATEKDYAQLVADQPVELSTDAYPNQIFRGRIARVAPVFHQGSRQARVEFLVDNPNRLLKPGMFIRAEAVLDRVDNATIVPADALTKRDGRSCIFLLSEDGRSVRRLFVDVGIRQADRVEVRGADVAGRVVTLGQQLLDDGSIVTIPQDGSGQPVAASESAGAGSQ